MAKKNLSVLVIAVAVGMTLCACGQENAVERNQNGEVTIIRPRGLSSDEALNLSEQLRLKGASKSVVSVLRFVHFFKRAQREPALVALEQVNHKLAEAIVASVKERRRLDDQRIDIDVDEGLALRNELQSMTECEREVASGGFVPLTGKQFCVVWDSGILELLPSPSKLLTRAARAAAAGSMARLPREQLRKHARTAAIMTRYESRKIALQQAMAVRFQREEELAKQIIDLTWDVTTGLASPD